MFYLLISATLLVAGGYSSDGEALGASESQPEPQSSAIVVAQVTAFETVRPGPRGTRSEVRLDVFRVIDGQCPESISVRSVAGVYSVDGALRVTMANHVGISGLVLKPDTVLLVGVYRPSAPQAMREDPDGLMGEHWRFGRMAWIVGSEDWNSASEVELHRLGAPVFIDSSVRTEPSATPGDYFELVHHPLYSAGIGWAQAVGQLQEERASRDEYMRAVEAGSEEVGGR